MNIQTDNEVRAATSEEVAEIEAVRDAAELQQEQTAAALEARKAPLRRLGLTEEEIITVLGL